MALSNDRRRRRDSGSGFLGPCVRAVDLLPGGVDPFETLDFGEFSRFEVLVHVEEVSNLDGEVRRQSLEVPHGLPHGIAAGHGDDLSIGAHLIGHPEHAHRPGFHQAPGEGRLADEDQGIEGIPVLGQGVGHESVVSRIESGRKQPPVESDQVTFVVVLILVPAASRDLHDDLEQAIVNHIGTILSFVDPSHRVERPLQPTGHPPDLVGRGPIPPRATVGVVPPPVRERFNGLPEAIVKFHPDASV